MGPVLVVDDMLDILENYLRFYADQEAIKKLFTQALKVELTETGVEGEWEVSPTDDYSGGIESLDDEISTKEMDPEIIDFKKEQTTLNASDDPTEEYYVE